jgi:hypothetical protein
MSIIKNNNTNLAYFDDSVINFYIKLILYSMKTIF